MLCNWKAAIADSTPINETELAAQFAQARCVDDLSKNDLYVLPKEAMDGHLAHKHQHEGIDEGVDMLEKGSSSESNYAGPSHDEVRSMIQEGLAEHEKSRLRRLFEDGYKKVVVTLFHKVPVCSIKNIRTPIYKLME